MGFISFYPHMHQLLNIVWYSGIQNYFHFLILLSSFCDNMQNLRQTWQFSCKICSLYPNFPGKYTIYRHMHQISVKPCIRQCMGKLSEVVIFRNFCDNKTHILLLPVSCLVPSTNMSWGVWCPDALQIL